MTKGILYILYDREENFSEDKKLLNLLKNSISSLREFCSLPITIFSNLDLNLNFKNVEIRKHVYNQDQDKTAQKLFWLKNLPYDVTIFIDLDTTFFDDPEQLISDDYDFAICREHRFRNGKGRGYPRLCKALNTGFFIAKRGKVYDEVMDKAMKVYEGELPCDCEKPSEWSDQWAINNGLEYVFDITIKILPQKWNVRNPLKNKISDVKMLHQ